MLYAASMDSAKRTLIMPVESTVSFAASPHSVRHSTAMHMLQGGVDITVIALWLGHESPTTTHMYVEADLAMKERALNAVQPPRLKQKRYQPTDSVLHFLQTL